MIVKKVKNPKKSASKAARVGGLADYILSPEKDNADEKCIYAGARGFLTDEPQSHKAEMLALAQEAVRSKDPINHYVLSWREGEQPSPAQVEQAVNIFLGELGLTDHQVIYGLHADTDNVHLHVAVNRVHPETLKVIKPNKGFDIEAAHRAIARIEHVQGWKREQNARYQVLENDELGRAAFDPQRPRQPDQPKRDMEQRTGEKSAERIAIEDGAPLVQRATSWAQLHRDLAAKGMRYEKTGSGATLFVGDVGVKASSAHREASLAKLQKRLGVYEPAPARQHVAERRPEPVQADVPGWGTYIGKRQAHYAAKGVATLVQSTREDAERRQLAERQKAQRTEVLQGNHAGRGTLRNALQSVIAKEQATEKAELKARHRQERLRLREQFRPYPDLEQWQRQQQRPELAEDWRRRASAPQRIEGATTEAPTPREMRWFVGEIHGQEVHYFRRRVVDVGRAPEESAPDAVVAGRDEVASFVDKGKVIEIYDWRDRETTRAALQLSAEKWGRFEVRGNDEYKALCVSLAVEHGFEVTNAELQERIQAGRQRVQQERQQRAAAEAQAERAQALKPEALREFEAYHQAVSAERYRVTSVRLEPGAARTTFVLDQKDGQKDGGGTGSSPEDVARRLSERSSEGSRPLGRGESVHYTPLSEHKHHIVIDGMDAEKLGRLMRDGYRPAAVLEIRPGRYQAILTVLKLPAPRGLDVGRRLAAQLNGDYGDLSLSGRGPAGDVPAGGVQSHPAPGYESRGPGQGESGVGGARFVVRLHQAQGRECVTALELAAQIASQYRQEVAQRVPEAGGVGLPVPTPGNALQGPADAYKRHYGDVLKRQQGGKIDLSRVDSMIAVRMRVTGHSQVDVEAALRQCAPGIRPPGEVRDWNDYAQRTARYAYSPAGERQAHELGKYRERWERLEGRAPTLVLERAPDREQEKRIEQERQRGPRLGM